MDLKFRYLTQSILEDLKEKMVFLGGPRQVGKTTLATDLIAKHFKNAYYNWDKISQRREALSGHWPAEAELIILDEFHKHAKWKTWIKGEYDTGKKHHNFLLTGSARLNIFRRGGDSLQGRYHYYRLHPFSCAELAGSLSQSKPGTELNFSTSFSSTDFDLLLVYGGFPEPLIRQSAKTLRRWHQERMERLIREDIRDLTQIQDIGNLNLLAELLPEKVASILSINSLARDLQVNFRTVANWLDAFEEFFYCFRLASFQSKKIAAVKKEKKAYLWDWSQIQNPGARLENLVASHLLKFCHYLHDHEGQPVTLHYVRDSTGRELDFLVCLNNKPWFAVEVKSQDRVISLPLLYFREKLNIPYCYQVTTSPNEDTFKNGVRILSAPKFLSALV